MHGGDIHLIDPVAGVDLVDGCPQLAAVAFSLEERELRVGRELAGALGPEVPLVEWLRAALPKAEPRKVETPPAGPYTEASEALAVPVTVEPEMRAEA